VVSVDRSLSQRLRLAPLALALAGLGACQGAQPGPDRVFVSDEAGDTVHVLDGLTGGEEGALKTGGRPRGLAVSPDGAILYVAASNADRIEAWSTRSLQRLRLYAAGSDPERFVLAPDGRSLVIANEDRSVLSKLDLASGAIVWQAPTGPEPEGVAVSPDGALVAGPAEASASVHFVAAQTGAVQAVAAVGDRPRDVLFLPGSNEIWVSSERRGTITVFNARTLKSSAVIDLVPAFPDLDTVQAVELEATRDGRRAFVAMGRGNKVAEIDPRTRQVVRSFPTGSRTWGTALSPDEHRLYAASGLSGDLTIIDLQRNVVLKRVALAGKPWGVVAVRR
jgi:PQQ-dependent catabolism-associated beta-propeller protein